MTVPQKYAHSFVPVKYFLSSYRALSDARNGIAHLERQLSSATVLLSEWKVVWIGTCATLRTAIDLFRVDARSCLNSRIRDEIQNEWHAIKAHKDDHAIFWEFLRKERDNVVHQYEWSAYEAWMKPDGTFRENNLSILSLVGLADDGARPLILMRGGAYEGRNSIELLKEGADWVETCVFNAIRRAGFDPDERRNLVDFSTVPAADVAVYKSLLGDTGGTDD